MVARTPLVLGASGHPEQLQTGDSLSGVSGGGGVSILNDNATSGPVYPLSYTGTGSTGTLYQSDGGLAYYPSTGALKSTIHRMPATGASDVPSVSGEVVFGGRSFGGRSVPMAREPVGVPYPLQGHLAFRNIKQWRFGAATGLTTHINTTGIMPFTTVSGTITIVPPSTSFPAVRGTISTTTTASNQSSTRCSVANAAPIIAGQVFWAHVRFGGISSSINGRWTVGLFDISTAYTGTTSDPATLSTPGGFGMALSSNSSNWFVFNNANGTTRTTTSLTSGSSRYGAFSFTYYDLFIFSDGTNYYWETVVADTSNTPFIGFNLDRNTGTFNSNRPTAGTLLYPQIVLTNNATAAACSIEVISVTIETEF